jgi:hypothetical protein
MPVGEMSNLKRIPKEWFDLYLRTGTALWEAADCAELKFNPWHDPATGQFTFSGKGTSGAGGFTEGRSGSGGGGAQASWGTPLPKKAGSSSPQKQQSIAPVLPSSWSVAPTSAATKP